MSKSYIETTKRIYWSVDSTIEHLENRISCQNRSPSSNEMTALKVLKQELIELKSVLKLNGIQMD